MSLAHTQECVGLLVNSLLNVERHDQHNVFAFSLGMLELLCIDFEPSEVRAIFTRDIQKLDDLVRRVARDGVPRDRARMVSKFIRFHARCT